MMKDNIWWTRRARIETEKRLLANLFHAELLLIWYALWSVGISIYLLEFQENTPQYLLVTFSVMTLAASLYINTQSYKERAIKVKSCYERLGMLYRNCVDTEISDEYKRYLKKEYSECLDMCENHNNEDYYNAVVYEYFFKTSFRNIFLIPYKKAKNFLLSIDDTKKSKKTNTNGLTKKPNWFMLFLFSYNALKKLISRLFLYLLPIIILYISIKDQ